MRRTLLFFIVLMCSLSSYAQKDTINYADYIGGGYDKFGRYYSYSTGSLVDEEAYRQGSANLYYLKVVKNGISSYQLHLTTHMSIPSADKKGVIIILQNNQRIDKPDATVETSVDDQGYVADSWVHLNVADIAKLKKSGITDFELYAFDDTNPLPEKFRKIFIQLCNTSPSNKK